jgi:phenylacetate-CoA ligase
MMPWLSRRIVYPLQERVVGRPTFRYLEELEQSQWLSRPELETLQARKLNRLLLTALEHSPWHSQRIQQAGLERQVREGSVSLRDLTRLALMDKRDARENTDRIVWKGVPGGAFKYTTGGSSGEPLIFYFGRSRQAADAAGRMRARRWWGVDVGDREVYLWGAPVELNKTDRIKTLRDRLINQLLLNAFEMSPTRMDEYLQAIAAWQPKCIYGYASSLALLAAHAKSKNVRLKLSQLKVVSTTGEPLYPHQRELINRVFGVPVSNEYGARDAGLMALESPGKRLLQMSETHIIEVLDEHGKTLPAGQLGEAVITSLVSEAQPFIRYRTGDMVRLGTETEMDGRGLHVIAEVAGRQTDFIVREDGTLMHALAVIYVLRAVRGVAQFKIIQHTPLDVEVLVVPDADWNEASGQAVAAGLKARLGRGLKVDLKLANEIPMETSGKFRYVVSHVAIAEYLKQAVPCLNP